MPSAGRSFTDPPGLNHSAFAQKSTFGNSLPTRSSRSSGVFPIRSSKASPVRPDCAADSRWEEAGCPVVAMSRYLGRFSQLHQARDIRPFYSELDAAGQVRGIDGILETFTSPFAESIRQGLYMRARHIVL